MKKSGDLYATLGVEKTASADELRRAYRKLARKLHPDVNPGDKAAEDRFKEVSAAHEVLSDPKKRALYDEFGEGGLREGFDAENARQYQKWADRGGARPSPGGRGFASSFDFADIFGEFFGGEGHAPKGQDLLATVEVELGQALRGTEVRLEVPINGATEVVTVRIPAGADEGSRLRVPGRGAVTGAGGARGDLIIETRVRPHPYFQRRGLDLFLRLPVTLAEVYGGAAVTVPTPTGEVKLRVPARSQNGDELRLRGKGVARGNKRGDLYVTLDVRMPDSEDEALAAALREAEKSYTVPVRQNIRL